MDTYRELYLDKQDQLIKAVTTAIKLRQENERLQEIEIAARKLEEKMEAVMNSAEYFAVFSFWHSHFGDYKGGSWEMEFSALRHALKNKNDVGTEWICSKCKTTNMLDVPTCQACFHPREQGGVGE